MLNRLEGVPAVLELFLLAVAALGAVWGIWMGIYRPLSKHFSRVNAGMDTLLGYPPVLDPGSGRELQPATPPLATRVFDLEQTNKKMAEALTVLAANQRDLLHLQEEMDRRKAQSEQFMTEFAHWQARVDLALGTWIEEQDQLGQIVRENARLDSKGVEA